MAAPQPKSIFDLPPLETGGVKNREGLAFQDHVAAGLCLTMLLDTRLDQVWCETQDDITLIWKVDDEVRVEFVQVKSNELDQLWSISILCDREGKGAGHSILEKSLANDRCKEPTSFRMVTLRPIQGQLSILRHPLDSAYRRRSDEGVKEITALKEAIEKKLGNGFTSTNGNDCSFWVDHATWDERHAETAIKNESLRTLARLIQEDGTFLTEDQMDEVYARLLSKVWNAGRANPKTQLSVKRISRIDLIEWFRSILAQVLHPASVGTGKTAERKMKEAALPTDVILAAHELRRAYRQEVLRPQYLAIKDRRLVEGEVLATLQELKSQLDVGGIPDSGINFHNLCLQRLSKIRNSLRLNQKPPLMFLQGYMYNVVDRCVHRFRRARA